MVGSLPQRELCEARVRLLDLGRTTALRSQAVYHAVAECAGADDPPTLCILHPDRPYVSIGYHQDAAREIDLDYCRSRGIPVIRRRVGGGAVLLDADQLFFHLLLPHKRLAALGLTRRFDERYARLAAPAIAAYRALGVPAAFRPVNDIHVDGRKIGGTGAADIEECFVFVGSMMLAFDHALMARVLRFADEGMRREVQRSIERYVTSLEQLCGEKPDLAMVHDALLAGFCKELTVELEPGHLSSVEASKAAELEALFASEDWLNRITWSRERPRALAINCAVRYLEALTTNGVTVAVRVVEGAVDSVRVGGAADGAEVATLTRKLIAAAGA